MNKVITLTALAVAAGVSTNLYAQSSENTTELDPIIVSGGISPVSADEFGRSYSTVSAREIEERGLATVQDAIEALPGVSLSGDAPSNTQIRVRGGEAGHTLVLIDGVRVAAGDSEYFLRGLDTAHIERIELLRGPQSVPYGTDASTGVINIITRAAGEGLTYGGSAEIGEGDRQSGYLTYGGDRSDLSINLSRRYDSGYDYSGNNGEEDSTTWETLHAKGGLDLNDAFAIEFVLRSADGDWDTDDLAPTDQNFVSTATNEAEYIEDDPVRQTSRKERLGSISLIHQAFDRRLRQRLRFDRTDNESVPYTGSSTEEQTDLAQYRIEFSADGESLELSNQVFALLLDRKEDSGESTQRYEREADSIAFEYQGQVTDSLSLQAGIRRDDNSDFSDETTWNLAGSYFLESGPRLHASAGRAIVNPGFTEIFGADGDFPTVGNPNLVPEENEGYEAGVEFPLMAGKGFVDLTYFNETLTDEIVFSGVADPYNYSNQRGESDRDGIELSAALNAGGRLRTGGSFTYLDATDPDGTRETRRPRHEYSLNARWDISELSTILAADLRHVRGLYDNQGWAGGEDGARLPNFTTVDLAATHELNERLELIARVDNLFDEDNQEVWGYATRGRAGFIGLSASW